MNSRLFRGYNRIVGVFWAVIGVTFLIQMFDYLPWWAALTFTSSTLIPYYLSCSYLTNFLQPRAMTENKMNYFIFEFLIATFAMTLIFVSTCYLFYILELNGHFPKSTLFKEINPYISEVLGVLPTFILLNIAFCGLRLYYEHTKLQRVHLETQLQMLQSQVNPHYMFNILNHIHILIRTDVDKASFLLEKYSEILRYQLYNSRKETVPLSQEVKFIKDIISVERLRWGDELEVATSWDIEDNWKNIQPMILIVFIENAFKHVSRSISEKGYINIALKQRNNVICMEVENSKWKHAELKKKSGSSGLGIRNTQDRLDILYPKNHKLKIKETDWMYRVELTITLEEGWKQK